MTQDKSHRKSPEKGNTQEASQSQSVSIIISARDEARSIGSIISRIKESLASFAYEIVVVNDGSRDGTSEIARNNGTVVISHRQSLGKGAAMKSGVENSRGDIVVFLDGDGAHDPRDIPRVIAPLLEGTSDLIIGSRCLPESKVATFPLARKLTNSLASFIISALVSFPLPLALLKFPRKYIKITDCTSGFRAIKKDTWQKLDLISQGFQIETEMIYEAARSGLTITEIPISCQWHSDFSRLSVVRDGVKTLTLLAGKLIGDIGGRARPPGKKVTATANLIRTNK